MFFLLQTTGALRAEISAAHQLLQQMYRKQSIKNHQQLIIYRRWLLIHWVQYINMNSYILIRDDSEQLSKSKQHFQWTLILFQVSTFWMLDITGPCSLNISQNSLHVETSKKKKNSSFLTQIWLVGDFWNINPFKNEFIILVYCISIPLHVIRPSKSQPRLTNSISTRE